MHSKPQFYANLKLIYAFFAKHSGLGGKEILLYLCLIFLDIKIDQKGPIKVLYLLKDKEKY